MLSKNQKSAQLPAGSVVGFVDLSHGVWVSRDLFGLYRIKTQAAPNPLTAGRIDPFTFGSVPADKSGQWSAETSKEPMAVGSFAIGDWCRKVNDRIVAPLGKVGQA